MKITRWNVDLRTVSSEELFEWCLREHGVNRMLVAVRLERGRGRWIPSSPEASERFERLFSAHIRERFLASAWPGSYMVRHPGFVYLLEFSREVQSLVLQVAPNLNKWHIDDGPLPEDVCLFRQGDPHPTFLSVTHDHDAWLLTNKDPTLHGVSRDRAIDSGTFRQETIAFPGKNFCRPWRGKLQAVHKRLLPKMK